MCICCRIELIQISPDLHVMESTKIILIAFIWTDGYPCFIQIVSDFLCQFDIINIVIQLILCHDRKRIGNRFIWNIIATDIQHPAWIFQRCQHKSICILFLHFFSDNGNSFRNRFSGIFLFQNKQLFSRHGRTVFPDHADKIFIDVHGSILSGKGTGKTQCSRCTDHSSIKSKKSVFRCIFNQEIHRLRYTLLAQSHQLYFTAFQLSFCLCKVSAICPKTCKIFCDDRTSRITTESGHP